MMIKKLSLIGLISLMMFGCDNASTKKPTTKQANNQTSNPSPQDTPNPSTQTIKQIDWTKLKTGVEPINPDNYTYPFATDSLAVKNYANAYKISPKQAQHSMVLAMASPEALGKVLDQLTAGQYLGHSLTDGANMRLLIFTSDDVMASNFDYVFADSFGAGLVLPIVIVPKSQATDLPQVTAEKLNPHKHESEDGQ